MSTGLFGNDVTLSEGIDDDLYWACHSGATDDRLFDLIRKGADVNASVGKQKNMTCLSAAVSGGHVHTVRALLRRGANVDIRASGGKDSPTPLHVACRNGMIEMVKILLQASADMDALDPSGNTPADLAGKVHHSGIIKLLNEEKMNLMMQGGSNTSRSNSLESKNDGSSDCLSPAPRKDSIHRRLSSTLTDGGLAARELEGNDNVNDGAGNDDGNSLISKPSHGRSSSTDLDMLLAAHRQLTVRESSRDRKLQRIQDSVTNLQSGMHRMVTMVDGLRLLIVESLQKGEKETLARIEESKKESLEKIKTIQNQLKNEKLRSDQLKLQCDQIKAEMSTEVLKREELEMTLKMSKENLEGSLNKIADLKLAIELGEKNLEYVEKKYKEKEKEKEKKDEKEREERLQKKKENDEKEKRERLKKETTAPKKSCVTGGIGSEAQKRLARLATEKKTQVIKKEREYGGLFDSINGEGLFGSDGDDDNSDKNNNNINNNNNSSNSNDDDTKVTNVLEDVISTIHRERRPSATMHHKEPNIRRLSASSTLMATLVDDLSLFHEDGNVDDPNDLFGKRSQKKEIKTTSDDLFDFA
jgi:hypothetical protein